jgi:DNA-binding MarR family transcriptional regulator
MATEERTKETRELKILEELEEQPEVKQADLACRLGIGVGTVNWHLKRLVAKGYVKVKKIGRWRWSYLLTPQGMVEKARLTKAYVQQSMQLYRKTRERARELLCEVKRAGYDQVQIEGDSKNDLVDVCRLTCLEQGVKVVNPAKGKEQEDKVPVLRVDGRELSLKLPERGPGIQRG